MELNIEDINKKEIYRYLGYHGITPDTQIDQMIQEVITELLTVIHPKSLYKVYRCHISQDNPAEILLSDMERDFVPRVSFYSNNLAANLRGCPYVILIAVTLGIEADKLLHKYELINMAKASILQACGAAAVEVCCNSLQNELRNKALQQNMYLRPRFSPGYGELAAGSPEGFL